MTQGDASLSDRKRTPIRRRRFQGRHPPPLGRCDAGAIIYGTGQNQTPAYFGICTTRLSSFIIFFFVLLYPKTTTNLTGSVLSCSTFYRVLPGFTGRGGRGERRDSLSRPRPIVTDASFRPSIIGC